MFYGEFGRVLDENTQSPGAFASELCEMSVSVVSVWTAKSPPLRGGHIVCVGVVAGARNHLNLHFPAYAPFDDNRLKIISEYLEFFNVAPCLYQTAA